MKELNINEVKEVSGAINWGGPIGGLVAGILTRGNPYAVAGGNIVGQKAEEVIGNVNWPNTWEATKSYGRGFLTWPYYGPSMF